jgi:DNA-binding CsgD family transcriptional regulator
MVPMAARSPQLSFEAVRAAVTALDLIGLPAALVSTAQRLAAFNAGFERLLPDAARHPHSRLQLADAAAQQLLCNGLVRLARGDDAGAIRFIPIPADESRSPMIMHLLPVPAAARDALPDMLALLVITLVVRGSAPAAEVIQRLFGMTPAEARVARSVAEGETVRGIAAGLGLSPETVRSQLKAALAKAGCARNIDLAALFAGARSSIPAVSTTSP